MFFYYILEILDTVKEISDNLKEEQAFRERNNDTKHEGKHFSELNKVS